MRAAFVNCESFADRLLLPPDGRKRTREQANLIGIDGRKDLARILEPPPGVDGPGRLQLVGEAAHLFLLEVDVGSNLADILGHLRSCLGHSPDLLLQRFDIGSYSGGRDAEADSAPERQSYEYEAEQTERATAQSQLSMAYPGEPGREDKEGTRYESHNDYCVL